ncbi:winged helix-turn-helix domain-containing protein [Nonomuraea angiospora]|uniref:winged helix-turn-helix domain-containing protein n=1 Tax=Nonomuraea angiospora TaxID=46172 RepID=UPI0033FB5324
MTIDRFDPTPIYLQIAAIIIKRIWQGDLETRDPIPSESQMVTEYGIGRETARHVVAHLREQGWVFTIARRGTYVAPRDQWPTGER